MNLKQAKRLRKKAKNLACQFVKEKVLTPDLTEGKDCDSLLVALPERMYFWKGFTRHLGIGSKRWFNRKVKANPNITFDQIVEEISGVANQKGSDD